MPTDEGDVQGRRRDFAVQTDAQTEDPWDRGAWERQEPWESSRESAAWSQWQQEAWAYDAWGGRSADWREAGRPSEERSRDCGPPPPFVGLEHLELYSENLRAWSRRAGHALSSQAPRVIETLPVELQLKFKT
eukprot:2132102-Pyramimonas_sp.AAC.1